MQIKAFVDELENEIHFELRRKIGNVGENILPFRKKGSASDLDLILKSKRVASNAVDNLSNYFYIQHVIRARRV